jgi:hypothetical protein
MATAHAQLTADLDDSRMISALKRMDQSVSATTKKAAREFQQVDQANAAAAVNMDRRMAIMGGKRGRGTMMGGQLAMQAQDIAVQIQMGTSASRILMQQGTQIASIFGPGGAIVGGLVAIGVLMWDFVRGTDTAEKKAAKLQERLKNKKEGNLNLARSEASDDEQAAIIEMERKHGREASERLKEQIELQNKVNELMRNGADYFNKESAIASAENLHNQKELLRLEEERKKRRREDVGMTGQRILDRADEIQAGPGAKSDKRRAERARNRALRRAAEEEVNAMDKRDRDESGIKSDPKGLTKKQREDAITARINAAKFQKENKIQAEISKEAAQAIVDEIAKLITK